MLIIFFLKIRKNVASKLRNRYTEYRFWERQSIAMNNLVDYYNKFNEEKRLDSRHGQVEYQVSMKYIHEYIPKNKPKEEVKILDIGAGTGKYSVALAEEGYDVTAVELVKYNLGILKSKGSNVKAMQGNALNLKKLADNSFEVTLLFGPMYHLFGSEDKKKALMEAKRVTKPGGVILVAYCMNEYSVLTYGFKENHIKESMAAGKLSEDFQVLSQTEDLYRYMRLEDINALNEELGLTRMKIISPDGPSDFMRPVLNAMDEETFALFVKYHLSVCERPDLIGAGSHTLDILRNTK